MSQTASPSGTILGWTSTSENEEADMPPFSPFQSWDSAPVNGRDLAPPLSSSARASSNPTTRPHLHRHSMSLTLPPANMAQNHRSSYPSSPSDRRARHKREADPNWVPRPLNSFMVFRVEYSRLHAQEHKTGEPSSAVAEKTLSKRASEAWKKMSQAERQVYKDRAEEIKVEHSRLHPNYRYRPRRRNTKESRTCSSISRREQVVSFMERVESGDVVGDSDLDHSPPADHISLGSSSPEPPEVPRRVTTPTRSVRRRRSYSLPLSRAPAPDQYPPLRTYLLEPENVTVSRRARSSFTRPSSFYATSGGQTSYEIPSPYIDESLYQVWDSTSTSPSSPDVGIFDSLSFDDGLLSVSSGLSPQATGSSMLSDVPVQGSGLGSIPETGTAQTRDPLIHRRQRSNTTSVLPPSPLHVVSSSLANWNGIAAASTSSLPTFGFGQSSPTHDLNRRLVASEANAQTTQPGTQSSLMFSAGSGALVPNEGIDFDRTPRMADFPRDVRSPYTTQSNNTNACERSTLQYPEYPQGDASYELGADLEAYAAGLEALSIVPETYDIIPSSDELNFSDLFHVSP